MAELFWTFNELNKSMIQPTEVNQPLPQQPIPIPGHPPSGKMIIDGEGPVPIIISELCGRCWHNHIPGFGTICNCGCHVSAGNASGPFRFVTN